MFELASWLEDGTLPLSMLLTTEDAATTLPPTDCHC
jgi:hypothetical protein